MKHWQRHIRHGGRAAFVTPARHGDAAALYKTRDLCCMKQYDMRGTSTDTGPIALNLEFDPMPPCNLLVIGSSNVDLVIRVARLPRAGETVLGGVFQTHCGGKGANQAVAAARLSRVPVTFVSALGDDDQGRWLLSKLRLENLNLDHVSMIHGTATGTALIHVDHGGQNQIAVAAGANAMLSRDHIDALPESLFAAGGVLLISAEIPFDTLQRAVQRGHDRGMTVIFNPAPADAAFANKDLLSQVSVLTPNEHEAALLKAALEKTPGRPLLSKAAPDPPARASTPSAESIADLLEFIMMCQLSACVMTMGQRGCMSVQFSELPADGGPADQSPSVSCNEPSAGPLGVEVKISTIDPIRVNCVDSTGAGDAFNGALAVFLSEGMDLEASAQLANSAAALSVCRAGAMDAMPTRDELQEFARLRT